MMYTSRVAFGVALATFCLSTGAFAQRSNVDASSRAHHEPSPMVQKVRRATAHFRDVDNAIAAGYEPGACVSGPDGGAMGIHYVNGSLVEDGELDAMQPEALVYQPHGKGRLRLVAVEYLTFAEAWEATHGGPATLDGHHLNLVGAPNRAGLPAYWELHVWAWQWNPLGTFADWNPLVSCDAHDPLP